MVRAGCNHAEIATGPIICGGRFLGRCRTPFTDAVDQRRSTSGETRLAAPALALTRIRKSFDAFQALDGADFEVQRGEVHALLGENGAGKSSLMNVAAGLYTPDSGRIEVDGVEVALSGPRAARACRIGMVHQHFKLVKRFTVAENILLASPVRRAFKSDLRRNRKGNRTPGGDLKIFGRSSLSHRHAFSGGATAGGDSQGADRRRRDFHPR